jgi:hypothetical protein
MRKLIRRPSPGAIIATVALFFALGGSAYGLVITGHSIKNGTVTGGDIKNGSLASRDIKRDSVGGRAIKESSLGEVPGSTTAGGVFRQAVVLGTGALVRGRGTSSAARTAEGRYQVIFDRDVRGCAYVATIGDAGTAAPAAGLVETSSLNSNINGVSLRTQNSAGNPADRPFHLIVSC